MFKTTFLSGSLSTNTFARIYHALVMPTKKYTSKRWFLALRQALREELCGTGHDSSGFKSLKQTKLLGP